jgi:multicomponent Na+:H+ antiporter subunit D
LSWSAAAPLAVLATSLVTALAIFLLAEERHGLRTALNLGGAALKLLLVIAMLWGVYHGTDYELRYPLLAGVDFVLRSDLLSMLFVTLSALLWLFTTLYAVGYLEGSPHRSRFFGFFSLCVASTVGIALAGNLITFVFFYEMLTLSTYPLVVHRGTPKALYAGKVYLAYTLGGGTLVLAGTAWLYGLLPSVDFSHGGVASALAAEHHAALIAIFVLLIAGLGVKAGLVPLHTWLPIAMVAPAPVSALLHAVAVVKAGAFGIVRVLYDVYGIEFSAALGLLGPLAGIAAFTILYGSVRALAQDELKRRLAFSTVSQVSYIVLGACVLGPLGTIGGVVHLVHQGIMKITLFFCAGNLAETLGLHHVSRLDGVGRRMPWTMAAFTAAALGMIGVPPLAGFVTKWYLGIGAAAAGMYWVVAVLMASSVLNAAYFLPIVYAAWFKPPREPWKENKAAARAPGRLETDWRLLVPALATAAFSIGAGALAAAEFSPLGWAKLFAIQAYLQ